MTRTPAGPRSLLRAGLKPVDHGHVLSIPGGSLVETGSRYSDAPPFCSGVSACCKTRLPSWERPPGLKNDPYSCGPAQSSARRNAVERGRVPSIPGGSLVETGCHYSDAPRICSGVSACFETIADTLSAYQERLSSRRGPATPMLPPSAPECPHVATRGFAPGKDHPV